MNTHDQAIKFLHKAAEDELVLNKLISDYDISDSVWGFHAEQAIEKNLKAVLVDRGIEFPRTHDLVFLYDLLSNNSLKLPVKIEDIDGLTSFGVSFRYDFMSDDCVDRNGVLATVKAIGLWATHIISGR